MPAPAGSRRDRRLDQRAMGDVGIVAGILDHAGARIDRLIWLGGERAVGEGEARPFAARQSDRHWIGKCARHQRLEGGARGGGRAGAGRPSLAEARACRPWRMVVGACAMLPCAAAQCTCARRVAVVAMVAAMIDRPALLPDLPRFEPGSVWLAGAGPGDPGLLTLLALHALAHADVVVYDALVDSRILSPPRAPMARRWRMPASAARQPVAEAQPDISARLVVLAKQDKRVLRLKGGDPFVFGRGGEEALALVAAGIPFRVVPGVTAGVGGLAYAGIPSTHRDINSAVAFVTGHTSSGTVPEGLDWDALAKGAPVLVIYMALKHLAPLAERLIKSGRPADQPVAIISQATTERQRVLETTLARCAADAAAAALEPPAMMVVGDVVRLRAGLDWLGAAAGKVLDPDPLRSGG